MLIQYQRRMPVVQASLHTRKLTKGFQVVALGYSFLVMSNRRIDISASIGRKQVARDDQRQSNELSNSGTDPGNHNPTIGYETHVG